MLIEFRVENHRSIREEQALTMRAGRQDDSADPRPRRVQGCSDPLLPAAALYGANASGKSNVLSAMGFMRSAVLHSHRAWPPDGGVPRDPFAWGEKAAQPSLFEITLLVSGIRYQYGFVADDEQFLEEWLFAWPGKRKQVWFERELGKYKFSEYLHGENRLIEQITRPNALFLSAAVQLRHEQLGSLYSWFRNLNGVNIPGRRPSALPFATGQLLARGIESWFSQNPQRSLFEEDGVQNHSIELFRDLLRAADVGILDIKLDNDSGEPTDPKDPPWSPRRGRILVRHSSSVEDAWLPLEEESQGTLTLFRVGPVILDALRLGTVVMIDELEASLHPLLAIQILRQFNDPERNPRNAQILFTTHDTSLLGTIAGEPSMRRDQIWLTEKDPEGATCLYPLTDFRPRKGENIERGYLQGRYGAIPFLGDLPQVGGE
ncbi:hypothetical protein EDC35_102189 [Thiobaca trueperi]|uniref:ATPase AAA-type core domain-containing protein n=2 Tax=Thiobaca trueperi TaxID=127458 RepID=A0A4R3N1D3_9GAMM|nr:hypothetical protein EDC35_102189 [Thiobaca trueperi]